MAEIAFVPMGSFNVNGRAYRAEGLATGDTTSVLTFNEGDSDVCVHIYGTIGGATVAVKGGINTVAANFATVDDAFGSAMSFTVLPAIKPLGPAARQIQGSVTGGAGSGIFIDVFIPHRRD